MDAQVQKDRPGRIGAAMGIAFFVLYVVGFLLFNTPNGSYKKHAAQWDSWWNDSGHRATGITGTYLQVLGILAFVWFIWSLNGRFRARAGMMITYGTLFATLAALAAIIRATIPGGRQFGDLPVQSGGWSAQFDNIGFGILLVPGALSAGAFLLVAAHLARRDAVLPAWLCISGYVVGVLQLASAIFFPFILFMLWVLIAAIVLLLRAPKHLEAQHT